MFDGYFLCCIDKMEMEGTGPFSAGAGAPSAELADLSASRVPIPFPGFNQLSAPAAASPKSVSVEYL